jgi:DNA-binding winged helix-turn-helix (wHTH) protein/TolB-like protein/Flp pilus assembly protein TadD
MISSEKKILEFDGYRLDVPKRILLDPAGEAVKLMPKAFDILAFLAQNSDRVVSKDELLAAMWPDTIVEENNLTQNISALRRAFSEKPQENRFIATIPGRGYRFVAEVRVFEPQESAIRQESDLKNTPTIDQKRGTSSFRKWWPVLAGIPLLALLAYFIFWPAQAGDKVRSLAVLPFKPISAENRDEALELGMADSLITKLAAGSDLRVLPLGAVRGLASQEVDPQAAGRRMGVDAVLDGVMQIAGDRLRVSAKLIRVADGRQLWAGQFEEASRDIFTVQDSISQRVSNALAVPLSAKNKSPNTTNPEAYELFMRGKYHAYKLVRNEVQKGIAYYEQAISIDPNYALAYVELSNAYRAMVLTNDASPNEMMPRAKAAASKAVELDGNLAEGWTSLAFSSFWFDWDWQAAETNFKRALELDPGSAQAHAFYGHLLSNIGRHPEAASEIRRAREIDPMNPLYSSVEGQILFFAGRESDSSVVLQSIIDLDPNFWLAHLFFCRNYISKGMLEPALASANKAKEIARGNAEATGTAGYILAKMGRTQEARQLLAELEARKDKPFLAYSTAQIHLALGDKEKALDLLEQAYRQREPLMVFLKVEPKWNELHSESRFIDLMNKMNFQ